MAFEPLSRIRLRAGRGEAGQTPLASRVLRELLVAVTMAGSLWAECRVPDLAPGALDRLSPAELVDGGHYLRAEKALEPVDAKSMWLLSRAKAALGKLDEAMTLAEA